MKTTLIFSGIICCACASLFSQNTSYNQNTIPLGPGNFNSGFGNQVLQMNTSGNENCAFGHESLFQNNTGNSNTGMGFRTLFSNTTGDFNSVFGWQADVGASNLTNATAIGANAVVTTNNAIQLGDGNVTQVFAGTGTNATLISGGIQITGGSPASGKVLTSSASGVGSWQTLSASGIGGWSTLGNAGTVDGTNFIGTTDNVPLNFRVNNLKAGRIDVATSSTFFGLNAAISSSGNDNNVFGNNAFYTNTSGYGNVAVGNRALYANTSGYGNCATGNSALAGNTSAHFNTAYGFYSLYRNTGYFNTAAGAEIMPWNTTGSNNSSFGFWGLYYNSTGSYNVSLGDYSLMTNTTGGHNTALGSAADVSANNLSNATALGSGAIANASNKVVIGNTASGIVIGGYANWSNLSDGRFKENVTENVPGLSFINKLRPVTYTFNTKKLDEHLMQNMPDSIKALRMKKDEEYAAVAGKIQTGFIAQEVEKTAKELGYHFDGVNAPKNPTDNYSIAYSQFIMPLVKAVQEQQQMIEEQKQANQKMQEQIDLLRKSNEELLNKSGNTTGINNPQNNPAQDYSMEQNIPNPFTHETVIKYSLPQNVNSAYMGVYDMNGKQVATFPVNERGTASLTITSDKLSAGMYFYSIIADGKIIDSKRMIVAEK